MTIPEYPGLMQPVLHTLEETSRDMPFEPLMKSVGARLGLTAEERAMPLPSGNGTVFANRLQWALAYLERSGAVEERDGRYRPAGPRNTDRQPVFQIGVAQPGASRAAVPNPWRRSPPMPGSPANDFGAICSTASMPSRRSSSSA
jgi:restriction endonuclease Mrr